jgi:hypothetical protein
MSRKDMGFMIPHIFVGDKVWDEIQFLHKKRPTPREIMPINSMRGKVLTNKGTYPQRDGKIEIDKWFISLFLSELL